MKNWIIMLLMALTILPIGNSISMTSQSSYDYSFTKQLNVQESYQLYGQKVEGYANLSVSVNANILNESIDHLSFDNGTIFANITDYWVQLNLKVDILKSTFDSNVTLANITVGIGEYYNYYQGFQISTDDQYALQINQTYQTGKTYNLNQIQKIEYSDILFKEPLSNFSISANTLLTDYNQGFNLLPNGSYTYGYYTDTSLVSDSIYYPINQNQFNNYAKTTYSLTQEKGPLSTVTVTKTKNLSFLTVPFLAIVLTGIASFKLRKRNNKQK